jgi:hypothetical protein
MTIINKMIEEKNFLLFELKQNIKYQNDYLPASTAWCEDMLKKYIYLRELSEKIERLERADFINFITR